MNADSKDALATLAAERLRLIHWDGTGCGTHGTSACVNCFGPSPMDAHEVAAEVIAAVLPLIRNDAIDGVREVIQAMYKRGPGDALQGKPETWRKGMAKAHRVVRDYQEAFTKEQS